MMRGGRRQAVPRQRLAQIVDQQRERRDARLVAADQHQIGAG